MPPMINAPPWKRGSRVRKASSKDWKLTFTSWPRQRPPMLPRERTVITAPVPGRCGPAPLLRRPRTLLLLLMRNPLHHLPSGSRHPGRTPPGPHEATTVFLCRTKPPLPLPREDSRDCLIRCPVEPSAAGKFLRRILLFAATILRTVTKEESSQLLRDPDGTGGKYIPMNLR